MCSSTNKNRWLGCFTFLKISLVVSTDGTENQTRNRKEKGVWVPSIGSLPLFFLSAFVLYCLLSTKSILDTTRYYTVFSATLSSSVLSPYCTYHTKSPLHSDWSRTFVDFGLPSSMPRFDSIVLPRSTLLSWLVFTRVCLASFKSVLRSSPSDRAEYSELGEMARVDGGRAVRPYLF